MVDWATVCKPKDFGGLGILNTRFMNIALLLKWIWKLYQEAEGLWADLLRAKYLGERDIFAAETPTRGSQFWTALQKIKWYFKLGAKHHVENGGKTYFWFDWWLGSAPLQDRFPSLFDICAFPNIMVRDAFQGEEWGIVFNIFYFMQLSQVNANIDQLTIHDKPKFGLFFIVPCNIDISQASYCPSDNLLRKKCNSAVAFRNFDMELTSSKEW
jgi:hypothetical protein